MLPEHDELLISRHLDGDLRGDEHARAEALLRSDPDARALRAAFADLDARLADEFALPDDDVDAALAAVSQRVKFAVQEKPRRAAWPVWAKLAPLAAAAAVAVVAANVMWRDTRVVPSPAPNVVNPAAVARVELAAPLGAGTATVEVAEPAVAVGDPRLTDLDRVGVADTVEIYPGGQERLRRSTQPARTVTQ